MSDKYKSSYRGYLIDHHSPDPPVVTLENLSPEECERFFTEAHIDHLMLYCKDHWGSSYYNTKIGRKHPGLKDRDWIAQIAPVLRKLNIEFTAYYCFEYDSYAPAAHPEWSVLTKDGISMKCGMPTNSGNAKWGIPCMATGYREYALGQLKEIVENYHPDSLFLDIFGKTLCYCKTCRERYRRRFGYDMPETPEEMLEKNNDLVAFVDDDSEQLLDEVKAELKAIDPSLAITVNFAAHYPKRVRDKLDYLFTEPWAGDWLSSAYARGTSGGKPVQMGPGEVSQVYNYQKESIYELATAEMSAQGCHVCMYSESMHGDGTLEFEEARRVGKAFQEVEKYEPYLTNRREQADVAIIQSDRADTLRVKEPIQIRSIARAKVSGLHREALLGAMKLCDYAKRTWCIVPEEELTLERMRRYKMLILPNLCYISGQLAADLRAYVQEGGSLFLSGECGICDEHGEPLADFALADLMGCHFGAKDETYARNKWAAYIRQIEDPIWKYAAKTLPPVGPYILRTTGSGAHALGAFLDPAVLLTDTTWVNWGNPLPGHENGCAALYENTVGKGKVLTACFDFFSMVNQGFVWTKEFFRGAAEKYIASSIFLETPYLNALEYTCFERAGKQELLVHELSAMARLTGGDTPELPGGMLLVDGSFRKIRSAEQVYPKTQPLEVNYDEATGEYAVSLPKVTIHNLYRLTWEA